MTMKMPTISEHTGPVDYVKFDPAKQYRYTWPGQAPRIVDGAELTAICRGANHAMLDICEVATESHQEPDHE